jgi:hypothetical protein
MATISITTTADQDAAAQVMFKRDTLKNPALTVVAWAKLQLTAMLDGWVAQVAQEDRVSKAEAYRRMGAAAASGNATAASDVQTVDATLAKYTT